MKGVILVLKFLENRDEVLDLIRDLAECDVLKPFKVGVAGSYVNATNKKGSSIDIVLKLNEGEKRSLIGAFEITSFIKDQLQNVYSNKINVLWLDLLEDDETKLIDFVRTTGIEANPESAYTNIVEDVIWADSEDEDSEDEDLEDDSDDVSEDVGSDKSGFSSSILMYNGDDEDNDSADED